MPSILSQRAMLATLKICQWSARRLDRAQTDRINREHNAAADAARVNKRLVSKNAMAEIQKIATEARSIHAKRTLPWHNDGTRILPAAAYDDYAAAMQKFRIDFESAVATFVAGYPDFVMDARSQLNGLFNEADYPEPETIARRFRFSVAIEPVPDSDDFRVTVGAAQADSIRAEIEARTREVTAAAMREVWGRIAEHVGHMAERLRMYRPADATGGRAEGVFRDSLVDNVRELVALLPGLNVTADPALAAIADRMQALVRDDADALRESAAARANVAAEAESILADVQGYLA